MCAAAAVLGAPECLARALAALARPIPQLGGALLVQVRHAPGGKARAGSAARIHQHGEVVPVDQADVIEVLGAACLDRELGEGSRWGRPCPVALHLVGAAVPAGTATLAGGGVEVAAGSAPEPAGPGWGSLEGARGAGRELEPGAAQCSGARIGQNARPHREVAPIDQSECCS